MYVSNFISFSHTLTHFSLIWYVLKPLFQISKAKVEELNDKCNKRCEEMVGAFHKFSEFVIHLVHTESRSAL